jgi:hypothetical protein
MGLKRREQVPLSTRACVHPPGTTVAPALKMNVCVSSSSATNERYMNPTTMVRMMNSENTTMDPRVPNEEPRLTVTVLLALPPFGTSCLVLIPYPMKVMTSAIKTSKIHAIVKIENPVQKIADNSVDNVLIAAF